jgi:hypothetical protein
MRLDRKADCVLQCLSRYRFGRGTELLKEIRRCSEVKKDVMRLGCSLAVLFLADI